MIKEKIVCAAIWYKELPTGFCLPVNVKAGVVVAGLRHPHCIATVHALTGKRTVRYGVNSVGETVQGFITTKDRFVDRIEAMQIAADANQLNNPNNTLGNQLYSEDIY